MPAIEQIEILGRELASRPDRFLKIETLRVRNRYADGTTSSEYACDVVVAVLDGAAVDSGTAFEVGYAYARGKPLIGVRTDFRPQQERGTNLMLSRPCDAFVECSSLRGDLAALSATICREIRALAKHTAQRGNAAGEIA